MKNIYFAFILAIFFLFSIPYTLYPVHAHHCADPATRSSTAEYCEPLLNQAIFQDEPCGSCTEESCSVHTPATECAATGDTCMYDALLSASAGSPRMRCQPAAVAPPASVGLPPAGLTQIEDLVKRIIRLSTGLAFVALFVILLWAGIKFLTSGGDPKALQSAQQTVVWALLGILFLAIAWLVLQLVAAFTGIDALKVFNIRALCGPTGFEFCK